MNLLHLNQKKGFEYTKKVIEREFSVNLTGNSFNEILESNIPVRYKYQLLCGYCDLSYEEYDKLIIAISEIYMNILNDKDRFNMSDITDVIKSCYSKTLEFYKSNILDSEMDDLIKSTRKIYDSSKNADYISSGQLTGKYADSANEENIFKLLPTNHKEYGLIGLHVSYVARCICKTSESDKKNRANDAIIDNIVKDVHFGEHDNILKEEEFLNVLKEFSCLK